MTAQAHILRLFGKASSGLRNFVFGRPDAPPHERRAVSEPALQRPCAALEWSKCEAVGTLSCALCEIDPVDANRLRQMVGILAIGRVVQLPVISAILNVRFGTVKRDYYYLAGGLGLPLENLDPGFLLTASIPLCPRCAEIGERIRQTENFKKRFKSSLPPK